MKTLKKDLCVKILTSSLFLGQLHLARLKEPLWVFVRRHCNDL